MQKKSEEYLNKFTAIILIMVLTLADIIAIGLEFASFAIDMVATSSNNIEFSAYFKEENGEEVTITEYELNAERLNMYIDISVLREGYFNGKIVLEDSNFSIVEVTENAFVSGFEGNTISLNQINSGKTVTLEVIIKPETSSSMKPEMLIKDTKVKLEGTYTSSKGESKTEGLATVTAKFVTPQNAESLLDAQILTNKIYTIDSKNKRVLQILVRSKIQNNIYPAKTSNLEVILPKDAENVQVISRSTNATNKNITFGEENFKYNKGTSKLQIELKNEKDENGNISFEQNAKDEFVITCIYAEDKEFEDTKEQQAETSENMQAGEDDLQEAQIMLLQKILTYDDKTLENSKQLTIDGEIDGIINYEISKQENTIYKGKIYASEEREYKINVRSYINSTDAYRNIDFVLDKTNYLAGDVAKESKIQYKEITITKEDFEKIIGEEGYINLTSKDGSKIASITKDADIDENGNIVIKLPESTYEVAIQSSKVVSTGKIDFKVTKCIEEEEYTDEQIKTFTALENGITESGKRITNNTVLGETITKAETTIKNATLKAGKTTTVELTTTLLADDETKDLYKNPKVKIIFPEKVEMSTPKYKILYGNGLEITKGTLKDENGRKVLELALEGEQTDYPGEAIDGTVIVVSADMTVSEKQISRKESIEIEYTNEKANSYFEDGKISKSVSIFQEQSVVVSNKVTNLSDNTTVTAVGHNEDKEITVEQNGEMASSHVDKEALQINLTAKVGGEEIQNNSEVHQGEIIEYNICLTNNSAEDLEKVSVIGLVPDGTWLYETKDGDEEEIILKDKTKNFNDINIKKNETVNLSYQVKVANDTEENTKIMNIISTNKEFKSNIFTNYIKKGEISLEITTFGRNGKTYVKSGYVYTYILEITNNTNQAIEDIKIKLFNNEMAELRIQNEDNINDENIMVIEKINANKTYYKSINFYIKANDKEDAYVVLSAQSIYNNINYKSNVLKEKVASYKLNAKISHISTNNQLIKSGDNIRYQIIVENIGEYDIDKLVIKDEIFNKLNIELITVDGKEAIYSKNITDNKDYSLLEIYCRDLKVGENITVLIETKLDTNDSNKQMIISNKAKIYNSSLSIYETNEDKCDVQLLSENANDPNKNDNENKNDTDAPDRNDNENSENIDDKNNTTNTNIIRNQNISNDNEELNQSKDSTENTLKITGKVWKDVKNTGDKAGSNENISGVKLYLIDSNTGEIAKNKNGSNIVAVSNSNGDYTLSNIQEGKYIIAFEYDINKYTPTEYQKQGVENENNSDAVSKKLTIEGEQKNVAVTDILQVNSNLTNIDLGLVELKKFDLELTKTINKVTVKNKKETKTYEYEDTKLAKVEISAKDIDTSNVEIEYTIKVKNIGDISGYVKSIVDYVPSELEFDSSLNKGWYKKDGYIYIDSLASEEMKPGDTKELKLILTKQMNDSNTGLISNIAEIQEVSNNLEIADIDSVPSNRKQGEDDMGQADIIIGIKTGTILKYTIFILTILCIGGISINVIRRNY